MQASNQQLLWMFETMLVIREFEETMVNIYLEGKLPPRIQKGLAFDIGSGPVPGEMHLAAGQEPVAVGVCAHLEQKDTVVGTHRPHHFAIAKGVPLDKMAAEIFGKATGLGRGKGGHMHLFDPEHKFKLQWDHRGELATRVRRGIGRQEQGTDAVAVAFFGEGAANQGSFHEFLNLAALWNLPVIFVCEDNGWAISVAKSHSTSIASNADRAASYGMPGVRVERNDALEVFEVAGEAVARARRGEAPSLIEVKTDRYLGHFQGDAEAYRPKAEVPGLREHDPIPALAAHLRERGLLDDQTDSAIRARAHQRVTDSYTFARDSAYPAVEEALRDVFVVA